MIKQEGFYYAEGAEEQRLNTAARKFLKIADEMDLSVADMMNLMTNLIVEVAFTECIDKESLINIIGTTYNLHVEAATKNETLN